MRSDQELERLLEDWLDAEARPIPHEVLEGALESISRTSQVGSRRGLRWFADRPMGLVLAAGVVVLLAVIGGLAVERFAFLLTDGSGSEPPRVWNPVADWRRAPNQENPSHDRMGTSGVWRYMQSTSPDSHDRTAYVLLPNYEGVDAWKQEGMDGTSPDLHEAWNEPTLINAFIGLGEPRGKGPLLYLHPAVNVILGWSSPLQGEVAIEGVVARPQDPCSVPHGRLLFTIAHDSNTLRSIGLDVGDESGFDLHTAVSVGDTIYFVIAAGADARCALTSLQLQITSR